MNTENQEKVIITSTPSHQYSGLCGCPDCQKQRNGSGNNWWDLPPVHHDSPDVFAFSLPLVVSDEVAAKIKNVINEAEPGCFYTFDSQGDYVVKKPEPQSELDALAAQVEVLKKLLKLAQAEYIKANSDGETDCVTPYDDYALPPQQHLREIRAEAAEDAIKAVLKLRTFTAQKGSWLIKALAWDEVLPFAKKYADSIRNAKAGD